MMATSGKKKHNKPVVLFVSHREKQCGVYQFGLEVACALKTSKKFIFKYVECSGVTEYYHAVKKHKPCAVIYNHHPATMAWLGRDSIRKVAAAHIQIIHEVTQKIADAADNSIFDYHIVADPVLILRNPLVFKTGRLIQQIPNDYPLPSVPTIGSFGFGTPGKGFEKLVSRVQEEFDTAKIRLNIPFATFADADGEQARAIARRCRQIVDKSAIELDIGHEFLTPGELHDFLCQNSLNVFFYENMSGRGISSAIDHALAAQRPIAVTKSSMFRHITSTVPSICIEDSSVKRIMENGFEPLVQYREEWTEENLIWDYERIIEDVLRGKKTFLVNRLSRSFKRFRNRYQGKGSRNDWVPSVEHRESEHLIDVSENVEPVFLSGEISFNRILDNAARRQYQPRIDELFRLVPGMMRNKIPEANVQQAFVLDTVNRFAEKFNVPKILCVGSYDDTAFVALKKYGHNITEVDPVLNYDLNTFMGKPSTVKGSYQIIFSTSVIEHVENDEQFITQIAELLMPGGVAIITCDFNDLYKPDDVIPPEDFRMYTQHDLLNRLLPLLKGCSLVDPPRWDCPEPDFTYADYTYTFATFVLRKDTE